MLENEQIAENDRIEQMNSLQLELAKTRAEAIDGRKVSGIEDIWKEDEEFYQGIDDANRGESRSNWNDKPPGRADIHSGQAKGSTVFINITAQYTDSVAARMSDMLLPTDDSSWDMKPTPVPQLTAVAEGEISNEIMSAINAQFPSQEQSEAEIDRVMIEAKARIDEARERSNKAKKRIEDWHVECQYHAENRLCIEDCSRLGSGVMKGPAPSKVKTLAYVNGELELREETRPGSYRIDPWNLYPDPSCGENIHNGSYIWERDEITRKKLEDLIGTTDPLTGEPIYLEEQIKNVLNEGPHKAIGKQPIGLDLKEMPRCESDNLFEIWYMYGRISKDEFESTGSLLHVDDNSEGDLLEYMDVQVTMVNNRIIKAVVNPLDTGDFPYDVVIIKRRAGMPWGVSIPRQIRTAQRILNGAARNLMNNAGLAGGPMWGYDSKKIKPMDNVVEVSPLKGWEITDENSTEAGIKDAFVWFELPMKQNELQAIIFLAMKLAEDVVGLPMIMQGQMGQNTPDKVGVVEILNQNASTVMRRIAKLYDDKLTEPHIRRYYKYHMQYGPDDEKGDYLIDARGSSALVERQLESQEIMAMANIVNNPVFGLDPKKWAEEFLKSKHLDPKRFQFDDEQWQQTIEQLTAGAQQSDPREAIAQLNNEVKFNIEQLRMEDRERQRQFDWALNEFDKAFEIEMEKMDAQIQDSASKDRMRDALTKAKTSLAERVLTLKTQKELANQTQVMVPPAEPPGRAPDGQAFQK